MHKNNLWPSISKIIALGTLTAAWVFPFPFMLAAFIIIGLFALAFCFIANLEGQAND